MIALLLCLAAGAGPLGEGAQAWEEGRLDDAVVLWQGIADEGSASGRLYYNLGSAWYRKGDAPRAVAYLRAAQRSRPRDGHVHHNLALARSELVGAPRPVGPTAPWQAVATTAELGVVGVLMCGLASGLAVLGRRRRLPPGLVAGVGLVGLVAGVGAMATDAAEAERPAGVVLGPGASVRDGAAPDAAVRFQLAAGAEVRSVVRRSGFALVEDSRGRRGWVPEGQLLVVP